MNTDILNRAAALDAADELSSFRSAFHIPPHGDSESIYLCGNSLGLQPKNTSLYIQEELNDWARLGVEGHMKARNGWYAYHELLRESTARLVGALPDEVVNMNHLTVNLHLLMVSFYRPQNSRYKIICEGGAFPSDRYALQSQVKWHGYHVEDALIEIFPQAGEDLLRKEDILKAIEDAGNELALVMLGGVHYFTGQVLPMEEITLAAHRVGAICGFDLAHAAGNIALRLHDWNVDFAAWCSYKYLNGGPGTVGGAFIHERHARNTELPRFAGWWGNDPATRFTMPHDFVPRKSADAWQLSNAPIFEMAALRASLELFDEAQMSRLLQKSLRLTSFLRELITPFEEQGVIRIITPFDEQKQGCQLSLMIARNGREVFNALTRQGVIADWREPDSGQRENGVIRVAPVPLYNTFSEVARFGGLLSELLKVEI